jgi:plastocyanin
MQDGGSPGCRAAPREPARLAGSRGPLGRVRWLLVVGVFGVMAIAVPVKMAVKQGAAASGSGSEVRMAGLKFAPITLTVKKGTTVRFDNNDVAPHTVTEDGPGGIDSGFVSPGKSFRLVVERRLVYHCAIHPFMKATLELSG